MRDILTILAGLVILVLAAALAVPPLMDWSARRAWIEAGMARALGQEVRTEGPIDLRLLPTPRLRLRRLRIGRPGAEGIGLDAMYVRAEIALTPLLSGEVRVLDARIGRAEIKLPVGAGGDWKVPARLLPEAARHRGWTFEDLRIAQFLLTTTDPATGRTDQYDAEEVRIQAGSPLGPWRFEGRRRGRPVEIALGEIAQDGKEPATAPLKFGLGAPPSRLDVDGRLSLDPGPGETLQPRLTGTARLSAALSGLPVQAQANVAAGGGAAELTDLAIEAGEGTAAIRLTGEGRYRFRQPALSLKLAGRRIDPRPLRRMLSPSGSLPELTAAPLPLDLSLTLDGVAIGENEDLSRLSLSLSVEGAAGEVRSLEVAGPGRSLLRGSGSFWLGSAPGGTGHVTVEAGDGQVFARALEGLGVQGLAGFVEPRPLEAAADISWIDPVVSLRDLRVAQGERRLSGAVRLTGAEADARPRLEAQLAIEGLDVSALAQGSPVLALARDRDLSLAIDARNVSHAGEKGGRITGRIATEGAALVVDSLEVRDLAGAEARLSGRIAPDGTGRIEGHLNAPRAAPLLDLFGRAWIGPLSRLVPTAIRDERIDLGVEVERSAGDRAAIPAIRTSLQGQVGGSPFEAVTKTSGGALSSFEVKADAEALAGIAPAAPPAAAPLLVLSGERGPDGRLAISASGEIRGLSLRTTRPLRLGEGDDRLDDGEIEAAGKDAGPLLAAFGLRTVAPVPLSLKATLSGKDGTSLVMGGEVAGAKLSAELGATLSAGIHGTVSLDALSLPWLASALVLGPVPAPAAGSIWSASRFGDQPDLPVSGSLDVRATALDLGFGLRGRDAGFTLALDRTGLRLSRIDLRLGEARIRGDLGLERQGGLAALSGDAAIEDLPLPALLGAPLVAGKLTAKLRFGGSGESPAGILANFGGAGDVTVTELAIAEADPAAPARLAAEALKTDEPLAARQWQPRLAEELGRGRLAAAAPVAAPGAIVGGVLRLSPLRIGTEAGDWQGAASFDLRRLSLDARGALQSREVPPRWSGAPPTLGLGWSGPPGRISRIVDPAPLVSGLATNVLARELDRVDTFEQDAAERRRRNAQEEMERQRKAAEPSLPRSQ